MQASAFCRLSAFRLFSSAALCSSRSSAFSCVTHYSMRNTAVSFSALQLGASHLQAQSACNKALHGTWPCVSGLIVQQPGIMQCLPVIACLSISQAVTQLHMPAQVAYVTLQHFPHSTGTTCSRQGVNKPPHSQCCLSTLHVYCNLSPASPYLPQALRLCSQRLELQCLGSVPTSSLC